ncbi:Nn.00g095230.m01.CDS01 [Neocucurbitaria sp. VM-36]
MESDKRSKGKRKRGGIRHGRRADTHEEQWHSKNEGDDMTEHGESAQDELKNDSHNKLGNNKNIEQDPGLGGAEYPTDRLHVSDLAPHEGVDSHTRREQELKRKAAGQEKQANRRRKKKKKAKNKRAHKAMQGKYDNQKVQREEHVFREKEVMNLEEQVGMTVDATMSAGIEQDEASDDYDDFDIDIYGDEETRRKYGKKRRVV